MGKIKPLVILNEIRTTMASNAYTPSAHAKIRNHKLAHYDRETVLPILDLGLVAHVGFVLDSRPMIIPMAYARIGEVIYIHGAKAGRIIKSNQAKAPVCLTVTHIDALVMARSAFHHSVNYRSVVVHGALRHVTDDTEKLEAIIAITNHLLPNRWDEVRPMNGKEFRATGVLAIEIETASAKVRQGPPIDEAADYELPIWAGELPVSLSLSAPESAPDLVSALDVPASTYAARTKFSPNNHKV